MPRLLGPDNNSRMAVLPSGAPAAGRTGTVYANAAGTILADILAYQPGNPTVPGAAVAGSVVTTDAFGLLPLWWWPDGVDIVWISVNNGPVVPINADYDARLDAAESSLTGAQQRSTLTAKGDLYVATAAGVTARLAAGADGQVLTADAVQTAGVKWATSAAGGGQVAVRSAYITTGDVPAPNNAAWATLPGLALSIPAVVGEWVELSTKCMISFGGVNMFYSLVVTAAGSIVRYSSTGTATPAPEGDPAMYPSPGTFRTLAGTFGFVVAAGDLNAGNVTFGLANKGTSDASAKVFASTSYPFFWRAMNYHVVG